MTFNFNILVGVHREMVCLKLMMFALLANDNIMICHLEDCNVSNKSDVFNVVLVTV